MLINCPRCGFSQPKDQYCAQCGVDMDAFKPKAEPLLKKILQSTTTHIILLLLAAVIGGQFIIRSENPQRWVQKMTRFQGVNKSKAKYQDPSEINSEDSSSRARLESAAADEQLNSIRTKELAVNANVEQPIQVGQAASGAVNSRLSETASDFNSPTFRILYIEVPVDILTKWINESSTAGLYQNLTDYSAGILPDFRKKLDSNVQILKVAEKKLSLGQSDTNFSGVLNEEGTQMIGLSATIEFKSNEGGNIHGNVLINRTQHQNRENYPAEFDLPKASVFFMIGSLKRQSFTNERTNLTMPPFQIFKSNDFMTRKSEFVIIVEPEYK